MKQWRGPEYEGEFPTLGYFALDWIERCCTIPDGFSKGEPLLLTPEMQRHVLHHYRISPSGTPSIFTPKVKGGRFVYFRGSQLVRPQKWGKGPFSAALAWLEALGEVVFDGWDANGNPVAIPWADPLIQVTAMSQDQADNIWLPLVEMGKHSNIVDEYDVDVGQTRVLLGKGGQIQPTTSSGTSRLGNPIRFVLQDETHSCTRRNGGIHLMQTQRRNVAGMNGRFFETTNGWDITEASMAQLSNEEPTAMYVNYPTPPAGSLNNKREARKVFRFVYGDSLASKGGWVDLERIEAEAKTLWKTDPGQAERFFGNRRAAGSDKAFNIGAWADNANPDYEPDEGSLVVMGVDGARFDDAIAVVATEVMTGYQWVVKIIEAPKVKPDDYEHDFDEVDGAVKDIFERFDVWRMYCDPQFIDGLVDGWAGEYGKDKVLLWYMNRPKQICHAVASYKAAIAAGDFEHDGDVVMHRHMGNAYKKHENVKDADGRKLHSIQKDKPGSHNKIDGAAAGVLSFEARGDAIASGAKPIDRTFKPPVRMR